MLVQLNSYEIINSSGTKRTVVADTIKKAVGAIVDILDPIVSARKLATGLSVEIPDPNVRFQTVILETDAEVAGCKAYPLVHEVEANKEVIFTAVPAVGYVFVNWSRGAVTLSTDAEALISVTPLVGDEVIATITANFAIEP